MITYLILAAGLIVLIVVGFPVGFGAGLISIIGAGNFFGDILDPRSSSMIARLAFAKTDNFLLLAIPFFLLAVDEHRRHYQSFIQFCESHGSAA